jgi:hypothetical protein
MKNVEGLGLDGDTKEYSKKNTQHHPEIKPRRETAIQRANFA